MTYFLRYNNTSGCRALHYSALLIRRAFNHHRSHQGPDTEARGEIHGCRYWRLLAARAARVPPPLPVWSTVVRSGGICDTPMGYDRVKPSHTTQGRVLVFKFLAMRFNHIDYRVSVRIRRSPNFIADANLKPSLLAYVLAKNFLFFLVRIANITLARSLVLVSSKHMS